MSSVYQNPPVIEALCEFLFEPGNAWDSTLPGLLWSQFQNEFPVKSEQQTANYFFEPPGPPRVQEVSRLQFRRHDNSALVQVSPNTLIVNHLRPYPTWEVFRALIKQQLDRYVIVARPAAVNRISLRYINRLELPDSMDSPDFEPSDYCSILPQVPLELKKSGGDVKLMVSQRIEIAKPEMNGALVLQAGNTPVENPHNFGFLLDLSFSSVESMPLDDEMVWIELAHNQIEEAFKACYTEKAKELFKPL